MSMVPTIFYIADIGGFVFSINQLKQADQAEKLNELKVAVGLATTYRKSKLDDLNKARQAAQEAEEAEEAAEVEAANIEIKTTELAVKEAEKSTLRRSCSIYTSGDALRFQL